MDIVPNINKDNLSKERIEFLKKQDVEYKYIGSIKNKPGLTLFSYNRVTKVVKPAVIENRVSMGFDRKQHTKRNVVREKDCFYDFALNTKNFIKHLIKYGLIEKKEDVIVAKKDNMPYT